MNSFDTPGIARLKAWGRTIIVFQKDDVALPAKPDSDIIHLMASPDWKDWIQKHKME